MAEMDVFLGDTVELEGNCVLVAPDGSSVTARTSFVARQEGEYRVVYDAGDEDVITVVRADDDTSETSPETDDTGDSSDADDADDESPDDE